MGYFYYYIMDFGVLYNFSRSSCSRHVMCVFVCIYNIIIRFAARDFNLRFKRELQNAWP